MAVVIDDDDDDDIRYTSVAAGLSAVAVGSVVGADAETASRAVVPDDGGQVARVVGGAQRREVVAVERRAGAHSPTRAVAVQYVAHVAIEARLEHRRRSRQRRHTTPVGRRQTAHVHVAVVARVAERTAGT